MLKALYSHNGKDDLRFTSAMGLCRINVTSGNSDYDPGRQVSQIDNFITANVDMIFLNAADEK